MDLNARIAQFENMVREGADPNNDMAWFSLGGAYSQAGRHQDAADAYARCVGINPGFSKAYQLGAEALIKAGKEATAIEVLTIGYTTAATKGDRMPMSAMATMLERLGAPVPSVGRPTTAGVEGSGFIDRKTGRPGTPMARPPFRGPLGEWIQANISKETFEDWIRQGTKVINELRLDLSREEDEATYDAHMREFLEIDDELLARITNKPQEAR
ncbi:MAG: Fe(2+)-trafficking protein [Phycisphaerae bacterium]|nr:Fe(2+)-trafficking protein [Phycisphaerae bacterium]